VFIQLKRFANYLLQQTNLPSLDEKKSDFVSFNVTAILAGSGYKQLLSGGFL
jgi:hypothetical protein